MRCDGARRQKGNLTVLLSQQLWSSTKKRPLALGVPRTTPGELIVDDWTIIQKGERLSPVRCAIEYKARIPGEQTYGTTILKEKNCFDFFHIY